MTYAHHFFPATLPLFANSIPAYAAPPLAFVDQQSPALVDAAARPRPVSATRPLKVPAVMPSDDDRRERPPSSSRGSPPCRPTQRPKFQCQLCPSTFSRKDNLKTHQRLHSGEMPFQCQYCGRRFRWQSSARTHEQVHERHGHTPRSDLAPRRQPSTSSTAAPSNVAAAVAAAGAAAQAAAAAAATTARVSSARNVDPSTLVSPTFARPMSITSSYGSPVSQAIPHGAPSVTHRLSAMNTPISHAMQHHRIAPVAMPQHLHHGPPASHPPPRHPMSSALLPATLRAPIMEYAPHTHAPQPAPLHVLGHPHEHVQTSVHGHVNPGVPQPAMMPTTLSMRSEQHAPMMARSRSLGVVPAGRRSRGLPTGVAGRGIQKPRRAELVLDLHPVEEVMAGVVDPSDAAAALVDNPATPQPPPGESPMFQLPDMSHQELEHCLDQHSASDTPGN